jgi:uncharacterized protein (TIGR02444 family)
MSDFLPHPFWNFSLEVYGVEGVAQACLDLQDRRGCDVNVLMFCTWIGASGRGTLSVERLRTILAESQVWQKAVVQPLRVLRRELRQGPAGSSLPPETLTALRQKVADAELTAEHAEQLMLASHHVQPGNRDLALRERLRAAVGNLGIYAICLGIVPDDRDRRSVASLIAAAFPTMIRPDIERAVGLTTTT